MERIHATSVALDGHVVLLRGKSGSGKSDLALRLIESAAVLVSDDYTQLSAQGGQLIATAPEAIAGLMEVRGVGIITMETAKNLPVAAIFDLVDLCEIERLPQPETVTIEGIDIPRFKLHGFDASAPAKVRLALSAIEHNRFQTS